MTVESAGLVEGKVAIVTGGAGTGMGRSIALTLAREGAQVVVNYRTDKADADAVVSRIEQRGGTAISVRADVFEREGCESLVGTTVEQLERVDVCVLGPGAGWHP